MSSNCVLKFLREARGKFPHGNIPRESTGKGGGNIHKESSPSFPLNFRREIMRKSAWKSGGRGWLARWVPANLQNDCGYKKSGIGLSRVENQEMNDNGV